MLYSEKLKIFTVAHPCKCVTVDGVKYRYILDPHLFEFNGDISL